MYFKMLNLRLAFLGPGFLAKGYHLESCDGRKHTALSEVACQGHIQVFSCLSGVIYSPHFLHRAVPWIMNLHALHRPAILLYLRSRFTIVQKVTLKFHIRECGVLDRVAPADSGCGPERLVGHRTERTVEGRVQWAWAGDNEKSQNKVILANK
jgi:hypothetical protein